MATVVEWISYEESQDKEDGIGGLGGWFDGHTWDDYLESWNEDVRHYAEAIKDDVLKSGRFIDGSEHQRLDDGVPLFDDGKVATFSFRGWGDLMAAIATVKDGEPHNYMEFYC